MFKANIIEIAFHFILKLIQLGTEGILAIIKALAWFAETNLGKLIFGELLSGFIITPMSLVCDLLWSIAGFILFNNSKAEKWIISVIAFFFGMFIAGIGAPEWCVITLPVFAIGIAVFLQSQSKRKREQT